MSRQAGTCCGWRVAVEDVSSRGQKKAEPGRRRRWRGRLERGKASIRGVSGQAVPAKDNDQRQVGGERAATISICRRKMRDEAAGVRW